MNQVTQEQWRVVSSCSFLYTDTHNTLSSVYRHRCLWSSTSRWSVDREPGDTSDNEVCHIYVIFALHRHSQHSVFSMPTSQLLGNALKVNQVTLRERNLPHSHALRCSQTLTTLDLSFNNIEADGARHLGEALKVNQVTLREPSLPHPHAPRCAHRHSQHLILSIITCLLMALDISAKRWKWTRWDGDDEVCQIFILLPVHRHLQHSIYTVTTSVLMELDISPKRWQWTR